MSPLRIVLLANTLPPRDVSGVGEQVVQLAAGLRERGHEVEVVGRSPSGLGASKLFFPFTAVLALTRAVHRVRPHVVQVHESDGALAALWLVVARKLWRRRWSSRSIPCPRLVALLQVSYVEERRAVRPLVTPDGRVLGRPGAVERRFRLFKAPLQIALGRLTARLADRVLCPSAVTAAEVARDYGVSDVGVLPNVTGAMWGQREEEHPSPVEDGSRPLLFVGRLRLRKGVEVLLEALREPPEAAPLWIVGDGEHRAALETRVGELKLGTRVRFLGRRDPVQVRALLTEARALVVPSIYEGMPLVVLEAMEAGTPVVASAVSGIPEVVVDGETGWLVPPEDPAALAQALREVLTDPTEARRRGAAGHHRLDDRYRPEHAAARWEETLREAVGYSPP